ncbi:MAG: adenine deaminase [Candidatus Adiutrix sp.]|jgi:adenine deaminase|nr:adenine deaminase [Candidatus Adiutrix sp.]
MNRENLEKLIDMAAGRLPADLLISNCQLADVFNQTLLDGPLALGYGRIVGWGPDYQGRETLDAGGGIVLPGLIDGHVHIESSALAPARFAGLVLPFGTTTVIADPHETANVLGLEGIRYLLEAAQRLPLNIQLMLPSCVPATPEEQVGAVLTAEDLETLIGQKGILGLGEVMDFPGVINHTNLVIKKILMARKHHLLIDGHSPGLTGPELTAYAAAGIHTDHECSTAAEMLERLHLGQYVLMRHCSSSDDLSRLLASLTPANARRCVLCTDDREAADIMANGHINMLLRQCVAGGLPPLLAVTLATLNAAECFGLKDKGAIAPGWDADLVIVSDLKDFQVRRVLAKGREVARDGRMMVDLEDYTADSVLNTVHLPPLTAASFVLPLAGPAIRVIEILPNNLLTRATVREVRRNDQGEFDPRLNPGLNLLAVIERHRASGQMALGVLAGFGLKNGALAVSVAHDSHNLVVAGDSAEDMLLATREVGRLGGGYALVTGGRVAASLALPVAGLMSDRPAREVADGLAKLMAAAHRDLGLPETLHPLMNLIFLTLPVIPELRLTSRGLFDVTTFQPVDIGLN